MKFSIITPTFNRPELLKRAVASALSQSHENWEMIVIIDSPENSGYSETPQTDPRVRYLKNEKNIGANQSRNRGLTSVSPDSDRVIFLDDDDYLAPTALLHLSELVAEHPDQKWIITNRTDSSGQIRTRVPQTGTHYNYARDYLIGRRIKGDATHCLETKLATKIGFSTEVKNGEEWLYFFQVGLNTPLFYLDVDTTLTDGYEPSGLNLRPRSLKDQLGTLHILIAEGYKVGITRSPYFWLYILLRTIRAFIK